ncbi:MAG: hypothetical protein M3N47_13080 [Chloroflexota bacterium]|nr:hypothetical protein [Chloroflexota bacterium]
MTYPGAEPTPARARRWPFFVALLLHTLVAFPYLMSVLMVPPYGVAFLWAVWGALLAMTVYVGRRRPLLALAVPPVAFGLWFVILLLGDVFLGWTA